MPLQTHRRLLLLQEGTDNFTFGRKLVLWGFWSGQVVAGAFLDQKGHVWLLLGLLGAGHINITEFRLCVQCTEAFELPKEVAIEFVIVLRLLIAYIHERNFRWHICCMSSSSLSGYRHPTYILIT